MLQIADSGRNGAGNEYKTRIVIRCGKAGRAVEGDPVALYEQQYCAAAGYTIDRIETAIRELDYRGNSLARRLSKGGSETLGLVLPILPTLLCRNWPTLPKRPLLQAATAWCCVSPATTRKKSASSFAGWIPARSTVCCSPPTAPITACCARKSSVTNALSCWMKIFPAVRYRSVC